MAATVAQVRDGVQTRLETISGLRSYDVGTGAERMPCAIVFPRLVERMTGGTAASASYRIVLVVEVWVPLAAGLHRAQDILDGFCDPRSATSVEAAIEGDRTLGGIVSSAVVGGFERYGFGTLNSDTVNALMAVFPVDVIGA